MGGGKGDVEGPRTLVWLQALCPSLKEGMQGGDVHRHCREAIPHGIHLLGSVFSLGNQSCPRNPPFFASYKKPGYDGTWESACVSQRSRGAHCGKVGRSLGYMIPARSKQQSLNKDSFSQPGLGTSQPLTDMVLQHFAGSLWH